MSETVSSGGAAASSRDDRLLCGLGYVLLGIAPFTFGVSALVALAVASARKPDADRLAQGHYGRQIRTFWVGLILGLLWLAAAATWVWSGAQDFSAITWSDAARGNASNLTADPLFYLAAVATVMGAIAMISWLVVTSVFGLTRLLSGEPVRR